MEETTFEKLEFDRPFKLRSHLVLTFYKMPIQLIDIEGILTEVNCYVLDRDQRLSYWTLPDHETVLLT